MRDQNTSEVLSIVSVWDLKAIIVLVVFVIISYSHVAIISESKCSGVLESWLSNIPIGAQIV